MNSAMGWGVHEWFMLAVPAHFCIVLFLCVVSELAARYELIESNYRITLLWFAPLFNILLLFFLIAKYSYWRVAKRLLARRVLMIVFCLYAQQSLAQPSNFTKSDHWKLQRKELMFGTGGSSLLGDLGGLNKIGTDFSLVDLEPSLTRMNAHFAYRYRFTSWLQSKSKIQYGVLRGDDFLTLEPYRHYRNLSVKTHLLEISQQFEFIFFMSEEFGKRYNLRRVQGMRHKNTLLYVTSGISFLAFMPKGFYGNQWHRLRPLHTEGQGLPGGPEQYKPWSLGIPFGIGLKVGIDAIWRLNIELTYTKTFTDYLDDVSTNYYNREIIKEEYGPMAGYFADPSSQEFPTWTHHGEMRGDPDEKDAYLFLNISLVRNITYARAKKLNYQKRARF